MTLRFPENPVNGQVVVLNGISYAYVASKQYWIAAKTDVYGQVQSLITNSVGIAYNLINIDGGAANSQYGGITPIICGGA
jgi:hypothetical protein